MERCEMCTKKCPQMELADECAKGRMYATKELIELQKELQSYNDKQEQGLLIELPVAIGETVYRINEFSVNPLIPMAVISFEIKGDTDHFKKIGCKELGLGGEWAYRFTDIGKTVFLTRSEAEEALAQMKGE